MTRRAVLLAAALLLAAVAPARPARAGDPAAAPVRRVYVYPLEGLPADSLARTAFAAGFDAALADSSLALEAGGRRANLFRRAAQAGEQTWTLQVVVRVPPPFAATRKVRGSKKPERFVDASRRASRGMTLAVIALSPEAIAAGARAMPEHLAFSFLPADAPAGAGAAGATGYLFPWREAGRASALLALELLHTRSGDLPDGARCDIAPAQRASSLR